MLHTNGNNSDTTKTSEKSLQNGETYRQVVRALQYITLNQPDIAFTVNKLCQYMHCLTYLHWQAVKRILRYLKHIVSHSLFFAPSATPLKCFTNSDWGGCLNDRRSTNSFAIYHGINFISWIAKK